MSEKKKPTKKRVRPSRSKKKVVPGSGEAYAKDLEKHAAGGDIDASHTAPSRFSSPPATETIEPPPSTLEQAQAENARLRQRNEQLEERNERLSQKVLRTTPEEALKDQESVNKFAETIGTESREDELRRLRARNVDLEGELLERRREDGINQSYQHTFELIKQLATSSRRFESVEIKPVLDKLMDRQVPFEATLVMAFGPGSIRFTALARDPARALLEVLSRFRSEVQIRKLPLHEDLTSIFALIDNQWMVGKSGYLPQQVFAKAIVEDYENAGQIGKAFVKRAGEIRKGE